MARSPLPIKLFSRARLSLACNSFLGAALGGCGAGCSLVIIGGGQGHSSPATTSASAPGPTGPASCACAPGGLISFARSAPPCSRPCKLESSGRPYVHESNGWSKQRLVLLQMQLDMRIGHHRTPQKTSVVATLLGCRLVGGLSR